jgi:hypothetical protein
MFYPKFLTMRKGCVLVERMQFPGRQVSTLVHANKMARVSCERGPYSHSIRWPERVWALSSTMDPSSAENLCASL